MSNLSLLTESRELAAHLHQAMASRAVIDEAKGILMAQRHCGAEEAFDLLVSASQRSNRKLRDVAQSLVESVAQPRSRRGLLNQGRRTGVR